MLSRRGLLAMPLVAFAAEREPIDIGSRRELFVDRLLIEELRGTQLRLGTTIDSGTALEFDRPWEGRFSNYATVIGTKGKVRLYYRGVPNAGEDGRGEEVTCYAESTDGRKFTRPAQNVILSSTPPYQHNFSPLLDRDGTFKALAGTSKTGLAAFVSEDGVRWRKMREQAVLTEGAFDSQNLAFWSEAEKQYVCYYRTFKKIGETRYRWVARAVSNDFLNWTTQGDVSFGDAPPEHLYTNQTSPYARAPHLYISLCARFLPGRQVLDAAQARAIGVDPGYFKDCSDAVLMSSRGGLQFDRTFLEAFLRPGLGMKNWVSRSNYPALNLVETGPDELSFYVVRDYGQPSIHLRRYALRLDGFASVEAGYAGGILRTKPLRYRGGDLELNFSTSAPGSVKVRLEQPNGMLLTESEELIGDETARTVRWKNGLRPSQWAGQPVRLRFELKDANLYSFRFF